MTTTITPDTDVFWTCIRPKTMGRCGEPARYLVRGNWLTMIWTVEIDEEQPRYCADCAQAVARGYTAMARQRRAGRTWLSCVDAYGRANVG